jgi:hypothetical protein
LQRFADVWDRHVREEIGYWCEFHRHWLRQPIPLIVVRYEELVSAAIVTTAHKLHSQRKRWGTTGRGG